MDSPGPTRRRLILAVSAGSTLSVAGLAGCVGEGEDAPGETEDATDEDDAGGDPEEDTADDLDEDDLDEDDLNEEFVDATGQEVVEVETREGTGDEPNFVFDPAFVRVDVGTTIRWINTDGVFHTVTSTASLDNRQGGGDEFDAQIASEGDNFEWVPDDPGRQDYYCSPHAGFMFGSVDAV